MNARGERIELSDNASDIVVKMAEGNLGALSVLFELARLPEGLMYILDADDMNLRGSSLWIAWKDYADKSIDMLCKALDERSQALVDKVNAHGGQAVTRGASFDR